MRLLGVCLLVTVTTSLAVEESCMDRCEKGFDSSFKCQCDSMCKYYSSCCPDYDSICGVKTRGDTFAFPEDSDEDLTPFTPAPSIKPSPAPVQGRRVPLSPSQAHTMTQDPNAFAETTATNATDTTAPIAGVPDPQADPCSRKPFDAFLQLKNGSTYAFRGEYFFELGDKAVPPGKTVLPGYPKRIEDVWGIPGPIDAAFTRINCQGKTYIFKGNKYWRFDGDILDEDYPRNISVGFEEMPDDVDAAFAVPASNHHGQEKVYFFKGDQYYQYKFRHQPSHKECVEMTVRSPSALFTRYTDMYVGSWEKMFSLLFRGIEGHLSGPRFINRDWVGIRAPMDAVMAGRLYVSPGRRRYGRRWQNSNRQDWDQQRWNQQGWGQQGWNQEGWGQQGWNQEGWGQQGWNQEGWGQQQWDQQRRRQQDGDEQGWWRSDWDRRGFGQLGWQSDQGQGGRQKRFDEPLDERLVYDDQEDQNENKEHIQEHVKYSSHKRRSSHSYRYNPWDRRGFRPVQKVYFFKEDQYYRVDLQRKTVDFANPPYPRPITKYWLGCPEKPGAEKK
ncbi:vitronectin a [Scleropages formosus]|uniref:Vitronectin n=1 Tax=Scleropages formosus TaxID=113540 RepID=A0A8C9V3V1_SCLFO|nr:vitronectin-like [Scleropages formosus]